MILTSSIQTMELSSRYIVVDREVLFRSTVLLTPYSDRDTIDTGALDRFIARSFTEAGLSSSGIGV